MKMAGAIMNKVWNIFGMDAQDDRNEDEEYENNEEEYNQEEIEYLNDGLSTPSYP